MQVVQHYEVVGVKVDPLQEASYALNYGRSRRQLVGVSPVLRLGLIPPLFYSGVVFFSAC